MAIDFNDQTVKQFEHLELLARHVVEGFITGLHKSPFHGFSVEFAEHRLYNKGESIRHIDWKLYARTEKLFVKRYEEETNLRCQIIIDTSSSMYYPLETAANKYAFSVLCAASIIHLLKRQRDAFGISLFAEDIEFHSQAKSSYIHQKYLFTELYKHYSEKKLNKKTFAVKTLHEIAEIIHKRSLVIIFSDMFDNTADKDEIFSALQHLRYNKHEVILFHVHDKQHEYLLNFDNKPYTFVDMETAEEIKLQPKEVKEAYQNALSSYFSELKTRCGQYGIDFIEADINEGFYPVLLTYLKKRNKLF